MKIGFENQDFEKSKMASSQTYFNVHVVLSYKNQEGLRKQQHSTLACQCLYLV